MMLDIRDHGGKFGGGGEKERWVYDFENLNVLPYENNLIVPDTELPAGVSKLRSASIHSGLSSAIRDYKDQFMGVFTDQSGYKFVGRYSKSMQRLQELYKYNSTDMYHSGLVVFKSFNKAVLVGINNGSTVYYTVFDISENGTLTMSGSQSVFNAPYESDYRFLYDEDRDRMYFINKSAKHIYVYAISGATGNSDRVIAVHSFSDFSFNFSNANLLKNGDIYLSAGDYTNRYSAYSTFVRHGPVSTVTAFNVVHEDKEYVYAVIDGNRLSKLDKSMNELASISLHGASTFVTIHSFEGKGCIMMQYYSPNVLFMLDTKSFSLKFLMLPNLHLGVLSLGSMWNFRYSTNGVSVLMDDTRHKMVTVGNYDSVTVSQNTRYYMASEFNLKA